MHVVTITTISHHDLPARLHQSPIFLNFPVVKSLACFGLRQSHSSHYLPRHAHTHHATRWWPCSEWSAVSIAAAEHQLHTSPPPPHTHPPGLYQPPLLPQFLSRTCAFFPPGPSISRACPGCIVPQTFPCKPHLQPYTPSRTWLALASMQSLSSPGFTEGELSARQESSKAATILSLSCTASDTYVQKHREVLAGLRATGRGEQISLHVPHTSS